MSVALAHYFREVRSFDVFDYGFGGTADFLKHKHAEGSFDWVITNPPFRLGEEFVNRSMGVARCGVAMLTRTVFIESVGRYERLFKSNPPSRVAQFTERVPSGLISAASRSTSPDRESPLTTLHRVVQRQIPSGMFERALVHEPRRCETKMRGLA